MQLLPIHIEMEPQPGREQNYIIESIVHHRFSPGHCAFEMITLGTSREGRKTGPNLFSCARKGTREMCTAPDDESCSKYYNK